ncbi:MAG: PorT family protein [Muribaculaceae bacterium]|nr:PorT family protein [Muribaculaceae bacterium]
MKKNFLLAFCGLLLGLGVARGQEVVTMQTEYEAPGKQRVVIQDTLLNVQPEKTVVWGIKGNLSATLPSKWRANGKSEKVFNAGFGASIGGLMNVYLGKNFYFEPELALFYEGYSYDIVMPVAPNSPSVNAGPSIYKLGVRLPLNVGYFINISDKWGLDVFTGPQLSYAFYGDARCSNEQLKQDYDLMHVFKGANAQRRLDLGWKIGVGFPVDRFLVSLEADLGITNLLRNSYTMRENSLSLGISYYFQ